MTKELTKEDVQAIGLAASKATKGPWIRSGVRKRMPEEEDCLWIGPDGWAIAGVPIGKEKDRPGAFSDAGYLAMLDPETVDALCELAWRYLDLQD